MLKQLRNLFSSSPRQDSSPSDSLPLPPCPVIIRRALYRAPVAAPAPLSIHHFSESSFLDTPPATIAWLFSNLDVPPPRDSQSSQSFLNTSPDQIVLFAQQAPVNTCTKSAPPSESSLAAPTDIIAFDEFGRETLLSSIPRIHPSSETFFAAMSPALIAPRVVKRDSPDDDDLDSPRAVKRIKPNRQPNQIISPTASHLSRSFSNPSEPVSNPHKGRATPPVTGKRKRPQVDEHDEEAYTPGSESESSASQHTDVAEGNHSGAHSSGNNQQSPNQVSPTESPKRRAKRARVRAVSEDAPYVDNEMSDEGEYAVPQMERDQLVYQLTREKARRLAEAVEVPEHSNMCEEETHLYLDLATRGCKPVMSFNWARDFSTLPESLFTVPGNENKNEEDNLTFKALKGNNFAAIKAFQELLRIGGYVRDCRVLTVQPQVVIQRAIQRYIRWALNDSGLKSSSTTVPVHTIYTQRPGQTTLSAVTKMTKRMERLAERHQKLHSDPQDTYWPTLIGFLLCGPILTIVSLDTNPKSVAWSETAQSRVKYLGQFDMSEMDQDVWNSLAIAIAVIHLRQTMGRLANAYTGPLIPRFRGQGDDTEDEDS